MKILSLICLSLGFCLSVSAAQLDSRTQIFLSGAGSEESQLSLVLFRPAPSVKAFSFKNKTRFEIQSFLQEQTLDLDQRVFGSGVFSKVRTSLWLINGSLASLTRPQIKKLAEDPLVAAVRSAGRPAHVIDEGSLAQKALSGSYTYGLNKINLPGLRQKYPSLDGNGVRVGIIDTGADNSHPDLRGKVKLFRNFIDPKAAAPFDDHGHGTHVAGTIAGGATSGLTIGIAPQVNLIVAKAFDAHGGSTDAGLLLAMQWMADPDGDPKTNDAPQVVSNSWNIEGEINKLDPASEPFCIAVDTWARLGILPVFAAGNDGPDDNSIIAPGACPSAITVGATDENDEAPSFSSRGPTHWKSVAVQKPDIAAPGSYVESADIGGSYKTRSGTSMAAPHIAGILAILLQIAPLSGDEAKRILAAGAADLGEPGYDPVFGWGRANILNSVEILKTPK